MYVIGEKVLNCLISEQGVYRDIKEIRKGEHGNLRRAYFSQQPHFQSFPGCYGKNPNIRAGRFAQAAGLSARARAAGVS